MLPDLSCVELEEGEVGAAGDAVEAEDAVHHPPPHADKALSHVLLHVGQPWARGQQLPPDHIHHVILIVLLVL